MEEKTIQRDDQIIRVYPVKRFATKQEVDEAILFRNGSIDKSMFEFRFDSKLKASTSFLYSALAKWGAIVNSSGEMEYTTKDGDARKYALYLMKKETSRGNISHSKVFVACERLKQ